MEEQDTIADYLIDQALAAANDDLQSRGKALTVDSLAPMLARALVTDPEMMRPDLTKGPAGVVVLGMRARYLGIACARELTP